MSDERRVDTATDAIDLDTDPSKELDAAMREALEAIEHAPHDQDRAAARKRFPAVTFAASDDVER